MGTTTTLADALAATEPYDKTRLKVDDMLDDLADHEDIDGIKQILNGDPRKWSHARAAAILTMMTGKQVSEKAVRSWRNRQGEQ